MILVLSGAAGLHAHAETVTSANAVGMVKITIPGNSFVLISVPFLSNIEEPTLNDILGDQLVGGMNYGFAAEQIFIWDHDVLQFRNYYKNSGSGLWLTSQNEPASQVLLPGSSFWILNRQSSEKEIVIAGEVPTENAVFNIVGGYNQRGYPFPTKVNINDPEAGLLELARGGMSPGFSDQLIVWNQDSQTYTFLFKGQGFDDHRDGKFLYADSNIFINPDIAVAEIYLEPGQGFWFNRRGTSGTTWSSEKNFTFP